VKEILKRFLHELVFRNYFITICAAAMVLATFLLNGIPIQITHFTIFLTCSTFLLYNFHIYSFRLDYSHFKKFLSSFRLLAIPTYQQVIFYLISLITIIEFFFLSEKVLLWLIPLSVLSLLYSVPLWGIKRKFRIRESLFVKMPLLASVWSLATVIIPLAEQNITMNLPLVIEQVGCRFFFVFALCIPFEIRDLEVDKSENVRTLPSVFGVNKTKLLGTILIVVEIVIHHFMSIDSLQILALDLSSLIALLWIFVKTQRRESYFYKLFVDGTMLLRFLFLYFAYIWQ
jgi:4-hydroxybenzoate polyprenyltransferase